MLRSAGISCDKRQIDIGRLRGAEFFLGLFAGFLQTLQSHLIAAQIDALFFLELRPPRVDQLFVEVVTTEVRVTVGGDNAEHAVGHFQNRYVERAAAEVEHTDFFLSLLVQTVSQARLRSAR